MAEVQQAGDAIVDRLGVAGDVERHARTLELVSGDRVRDHVADPQPVLEGDLAAASAASVDGRRWPLAARGGARTRGRCPATPDPCHRWCNQDATGPSSAVRGIRPGSRAHRLRTSQPGSRPRSPTRRSDYGTVIGRRGRDATLSRSWPTVPRSAASPAARASTRSTSQSTAARPARTCSRWSTTSSALRDRSPAAWMRLFDDRYKRTQWPYGSAVWGKKEWVAPHVRDESVVSMDEGGTNMLWAERFGREIGLSRPLDQAVRHGAHRVVQGPRHDGARVGRAADDRRRQAGARDRLRVHRRHVRVAGGVRRRGRDSRHRDPAARQGLDGAAAAAARQRRARAVGRHRLRRLHGDRPAARGRGRRLPRELDEQPAARRPEDRRHRDRAAVGLGGARRRHHPRRQPRQRQRARRGLRHDGDARPHGEAPAHRRGAGRGGQPALPRVQERLALRAGEGAAHARLGHPDRQPGLGAEGHPHAAEVRRHRRTGDRGGTGQRRRARRSHGHVQLPAHGRRARGAAEAARARRHHARTTAS